MVELPCKIKALTESMGLYQTAIRPCKVSNDRERTIVATLLFPFKNTFLVKRRNKVRNSVKLNHFRVLELCMFQPPWYVQYTCYMYMYDVCTHVFSGSVRAQARIVLVHICWFFIHSPTAPASPITRNVLHQD
jgi:hypothetical protein